MRCLRTWNPENKETVVPAWIADGLRVQVLSANITESSGNLRADVYESSVSRNLTCLCDLLANYGLVIY